MKMVSYVMTFITGMWVGCILGIVILCIVQSGDERSEEHTSELQSRPHLVCRLLLEKKKKQHK